MLKGTGFRMKKDRSVYVAGREGSALPKLEIFSGTVGHHEQADGP